MKTNVTTITSKWQTTIPNEIRHHAGVQVGEKLSWTIGSNGELIARRLPKLSDLAGCLGGSPPKRKIAGNNSTHKAMEEAAVKRYKRVAKSQ